MLQRKLIGIESEAKRVPRVFDKAADDWLVDVCEAPIVDCNTAR